VTTEQEYLGNDHLVVGVNYGSVPYSLEIVRQGATGLALSADRAQGWAVALEAENAALVAALGGLLKALQEGGYRPTWAHHTHAYETAQEAHARATDPDAAG